MKTRLGFVSNSSSSSFVTGTLYQKDKALVELGEGTDGLTLKLKDVVEMVNKLVAEGADINEFEIYISAEASCDY